MTPHTATDDLTLEALLHSFRDRGMIVGVREHARLHAVFGTDLDPCQDDADRLRNIVAAVLVKCERDRVVFDYAFDDWVTAAREQLRATRPPVVTLTSKALAPPAPSSEDGTTDEFAPPPAVTERATDPTIASTVPDAPSVDPETRERRWIARGLIATLALVVVIVAWQFVRTRTPAAPTSPNLPDLPTPERNREPPPADELAPRPIETLKTLRAGRVVFTRLPVDTPPPIGTITRTVTLAALTWAAAFLLIRRRRLGPLGRRPKPVDPTQARYRPWHDLPQGAARYLTPAATRELAWSVSRFVSDDETRHYDLPRTVHQTARRGAIQLVRERAIHPREVWLFLDTNDPSARARAAFRDVERHLRQAGVEARLGTFTGTPTQVRFAAEGREITPIELDGPGRQSIVLFATNGEGLRNDRRSNALWSKIEPTLRMLSAWPRIAFVDTAEGAYELPTLAEAYGLRCIHPRQVTAFLADRELPAVDEVPLKIRLGGERALWAAALALWPEPFDTATALALHAKMKLRLPADELDRVIHDARPGGHRWGWTDRQRIALLNHLAHHEAGPRGEIADGSGLALALDFWIERAEREDAMRATGPDGWERSKARRGRDVHVALLRLWRTPGEATTQLVSLCRAGMTTEVQDQLGKFTVRPDHWPRRPTRIHLPWTAASVDSMTLAQLHALGFAAGDLEQVATPRTSPRSAFAIGAALGVLLPLAVLLLRTHGAGRSDAPPSVLAGEAVDGHPLRIRWGGDRVATVFGGDLEPASRALPPGTTWRIDLERVELPAVHKLDDHTELWLRGTVEWPVRDRWRSSASRNEPIPAGEPHDPVRRLIVVDRNDDAGRRLAARLMDGGNAELAIVGPGWQSALRGAKGAVRDALVYDECMLLVSRLPDSANEPAAPWAAFDSGHVAELLADLDFVGPLDPTARRAPSRRLSDLPLWQKYRPGGTADPTVRGGPELIALPGGTFLMGSPDADLQLEGDKQAWDNEVPQHTVTVSPFSMGRTEVTRKLFRQVMSTGLTADGQRSAEKVMARWTGNDDRCAATWVTWFDAVRFCNRLSEREGLTACYRISESFEGDGDERGETSEVEWLRAGDGYRLPTEAEWEYAIRAENGTADKSAGDWFSGEPYPVGLKRPNGWGLDDIAGNVDEWCWDWYGEYGSAEATNPVGPATGNSRLLRGGALFSGAMFSGAWGLRSAHRDRVEPSFERGNIGFRVVRGPLRQP